MKITMNTDGGFTPHGGAACSYIIKRDGIPIYTCSFAAPNYKTNNQAEYGAVLAGLKYINYNMDVRSITAVEHICDSELFVNHFNDSYKVKEPTLIEMMKAVKAFNILIFNNTFKTQHVKRHLNADADSLCDLILDTF